MRVNSAAEKNPSLNKPCGIALVVGSFSGRMYKALRIGCLFTCSQFDTYLPVSLNDESTWRLLPGMNIRTYSTCALTDG